MTGPLTIHKLQDMTTGQIYYSVQTKNESSFIYFGEELDPFRSPTTDREIARINVVPQKSNETYVMYSTRNQPLGKLFLDKNYRGRWRIKTMGDGAIPSRVLIALAVGLDQFDILSGVRPPDSFFTRAAVSFGSLLIVQIFYNLLYR